MSCGLQAQNRRGLGTSQTLTRTVKALKTDFIEQETNIILNYKDLKMLEVLGHVLRINDI